MIKTTNENKFNIVPLVTKFSHEINADQVIFMRTRNSERTLLGQIEDEINAIIEQQTLTGTVRPCHNAEFKGIPCLEMEDKFGFFKSEADVRPGHAIWIDKDKAERLFELFLGDQNN